MVVLSPQAEDVALRVDVGELKGKLLKLIDSLRDVQVSVGNISVLRDVICSLETRVSAMTAQAPTEISWETVSEKVASEVGRASEWVNERVSTEVERVMHTRPIATPATSVDPMRVTQKELQRLEARNETALRAYSKEIMDLKTWINAAHSDIQALLQTRRLSDG